MKVELNRFYYSATCTMGMLFVDGRFECFTLELPRRCEGKENVPDKTAIPPGVYPLVVMPSKKHPSGAPHIIDVPGRSAIEMHVANKPADILGCVGVGQICAPISSEILSSGAAFIEFMDKLEGQSGLKIEVYDDETQYPPAKEAVAA
jgi:uncharacterized protein DUF5675